MIANEHKARAGDMLVKQSKSDAIKCHLTVCLSSTGSLRLSLALDIYVYMYIFLAENSFSVWLNLQRGHLFQPGT